MGQKAVIHSITSIAGTANTGEILAKIDASILEETANVPLRQELDVVILWTDTLAQIKTKMHDAVLTLAANNNYLELTSNDIFMPSFLKG